MMDAVASRVAAQQVAVLAVQGFPVRFDMSLIRRPEPLSEAADALRGHLLRQTVKSAPS
jgi:hypothetical protein